MSRRISALAFRSWAGFALIVVIMASAAMVMRVQREDARAARAAAEATADRIARLNELLVRMLDVEVGQRGYVITGDPAFLEPYRAGTSRVGDALLAVRRYEEDASERSVHVRLERLVRAKLRHAARSIARRGQLGLSAAAEEVGEGEGKRLMDGLRAEIAERIALERRQLEVRTRQVQEGENRAERIFHVALSAALALTLGVGLMLLIQMRRRFLAEQSALRAVRLVQETLENVGVGVAVVDGSGRIVARNGELVRLLPEAATEDTPERLAEECEQARRRRPFLIERVFGQAIVILRGAALSDERYLITLTDVTEARRADRAKSEFVATVSHELRTPVTSIRGALGMLAGPFAGATTGNIKSLIDLALRNAERLTLLINDVLDVEKLESGTMTLAVDAYDVNQLVRDAAEVNRGYADTRNVTIALGSLSRPLMVLADQHRVQQVLANLISNAVKFSEIGGVVRVTASPDGDGAVISVNDQGPGVPPEFQDRIFERFAQADASDARAKGGTGLGLSISRAIVEKHGSRLWFDSRPGDTSFSFQLAGAQATLSAPRPEHAREVACR